MRYNKNATNTIHRLTDVSFERAAKTRYTIDKPFF